MMNYFDYEKCSKLNDEELAAKLQELESELKDRDSRSKKIVEAIDNLEKELTNLRAEYKELNGSLHQGGERVLCRSKIAMLRQAIEIRKHPFPVWDEMQENYWRKDDDSHLRILKVTPKRIYLQNPLRDSTPYWSRETGESNSSVGQLNVKETLAAWDAYKGRSQ